MENSERRQHWEKIYRTKETEELSWFQESPTISLEFIDGLAIPMTARIIDMGGGDSLLADHLLALGYQHLTVADISETALNKARIRLGANADNVNWIRSEATNFRQPEGYDLWHDRATFHFLTQEDEIDNYLKIVHQHLNSEGILLLGTFSDRGPDQCSGLPVNQYSEISLAKRLEKYFEKLSCKVADHHTPGGTAQNFLYCCFRKKEL